MAEKSVSIALTEKKRKLREINDSDSNKLNTKRGKWDSTSQIITDMEENIGEKKEKLENINYLLSSEKLSNSKSRKKLECKDEEQLKYLKIRE